VQLGGRPFAEATVLQVARQLEEAHPFRDLHPSLWRADDASHRAA
jgi:Asp-tRNA(Asn)/Glu-tRNA(Gln) amidotransferase A subunit family amidase